jgi:crossover junction endodeoxyribonuclease RusA
LKAGIAGDTAPPARSVLECRVVLPVEFVVLGTPVTSQGSSDAKRLWMQRVREACEAAANDGAPPLFDEVVLRVAYFYVYAPAGDLDNIVKPIQDALKKVVYDDDLQVVDLVASMRRKAVSDRISMTPVLAGGFLGGSDFVHVVIDQSTSIEVFR